MKEKRLFGIYHTDCSKDEKRFEELAGSDFVNVFLVEGNYLEKVYSDNFELLKPHPDKGVFVSVSYLGFRTQPCSAADVGEEVCVPACEMLSDFKERVDAFVRFLKERGYYEQVIGFYMDEPMLWGVTNEQLELFTGYFRTQAAPDKRFFICFSLAGVAPEYWTIKGAQSITPESSRHLTDIAFELYHPWSGDYEKIYQKMMERTGNRTDIRVWFIPCTMDYRGDKREEHCLEHLENCYRLLRRAPRAGGLMCYTYHTFPSHEEDLGNIGLDKLTDPSYPKYWKKLYARIREIGREILSEN